jgi:hypothetical protein
MLQSTMVHAIPIPMLQRFSHWFQSLNQPVHVEQRCDRAGRPTYWAIDRQTGEQHWADSETELRAWLEERYDR